MYSGKLWAQTLEFGEEFWKGLVGFQEKDSEVILGTLGATEWQRKAGMLGKCGWTSDGCLPLCGEPRAMSTGP